MIREGDIGEKLFPDFPDMKVDFSEIGIGKIGKIGLAPPPPPKFRTAVSKFHTVAVKKRGRDTAIMSPRVLYYISRVTYKIYYHFTSYCQDLGTWQAVTK